MLNISGGDVARAVLLNQKVNDLVDLQSVRHRIIGLNRDYLTKSGWQTEQTDSDQDDSRT